jgi:hypothetical protein
LPPVLIIFKYFYNAQEFSGGLPAGSDVYINWKSSCISTDLFVKWITELSLKHRALSKVILLSDGYTAHCRLSQTACLISEFEIPGVDQKTSFSRFRKIAKSDC